MSDSTPTPRPGADRPRALAEPPTTFSDERAAPRRSATPGEIVVFGAYPQTASGADRTPIRWRVLGSPGRELFLLSEYILDCKRYHGEHAETTWRDCDLRRWLNDEFYDAAFDAAEKELIKATRCADNGEGSPDTEDRVFLPSVAEVRALTDPRDGTDTTIRRRAIGTAFARARKADGCRLYVYDKGVEQDYVVEDGERHGCSWWWTRTQLQIHDGRSSRAAFVGARGNVKSYGRVDLPYYGARPALKLDRRS